MKRRIVTVGALAIALGALGAGNAVADPGGINGHNCAGAIVSSVAGPGFGQAVSAAAHQQVVDDFGLADCGQTNRNNP